jgi:L-lactate dehydrogenase complex protein LldG
LLAADVVQAFKLRFQNDLVIGTTCEEIESLAELSTAVRGYLERHRLPPRLKLQPRSELLDLDWSGLETGADVEQDDGVAVCLADYGIAETGSVVAHSGASMPMLLNFLPLHLIIAVMRPNILAYLDDYAALAAKLAANSQTPRTMCLITGASGTTDIEGVLVRGAHGPKFLHIVIAG